MELGIGVGVDAKSMLYGILGMVRQGRVRQGVPSVG